MRASLLTETVGPLRIYRVTSSNVSFLNSGNLLHTIFPRSQCWCVDGQSIFVLRIRQDAYYRIELPHETTEDTEKISDFENVLSQVLQYERTRCPFTRGFEVELPERPKTPPRKVAPRKPAEKAKKWTFDKTWMPDNGSRPCTPVMEGSDAGTASSYEEDDASSICTDRSEPAAPDTPGTQIDATPPRPVLKSSPAPAPRLSVSERAKMFQGGRSITAPITQQRHRLSISSEVIPEEIQQRNQDEDISSTKPQLERHESTDAQSILSTNDSFYSLEPTTNRTPSPPFHDASDQPLDCPTDLTTPSPDEPRGRKHTRGPSEITIRPPSPNLPLHSPPSTPPLIADSDSDTLSLSSHTSTPPPLRMKRLTGASQKRAFSPMPHPQNLFSPNINSTSSSPTPTSTALATTTNLTLHLSKQFTTALIRKTAEIVLGPPAHLVSLMLRIAKRVREGGYWGGGEGRERVPGGWVDDEGEWEDDFGVRLRGWGGEDGGGRDVD